MASVNSISSNSYSSTSSIYGTRNVLSGLASGMDTEAMIQNSVAGYQTKLDTLNQQLEKLTWKQDAYRTITDKMIDMSQKYTSYSSKTNLYSQSYFDQAVSEPQGANASKVSATGAPQGGANVSITSVDQLATAAKYTATAVGLGFTGATNSVMWYQNASALEGGTLSVAVTTKGTDTNGRPTESVKNLEIKLDNQIYNSVEELGSDLKTKLQTELGAGFTVNYSSNMGVLSFESADEKKSVSVTGVSGALKNFGSIQGDGVSFMLDTDKEPGDLSVARGEHLAGKSINVQVDGVTQTLTLSDDLKNIQNPNTLKETVRAELQKQLDDNFGKVDGKSKVTVSFEKNGALKFDSVGNSKIRADGKDAAFALGIGKGYTSYLDTSRTLGDLLPEGAFGESGQQELVINGTLVGSYSKDDTLATVLNDISRSGAGVTASFSALTDQFQFTSKETGVAGKISFDSDLAKSLFSRATDPGSVKLSTLENGAIFNGAAQITLKKTTGESVNLEDLDFNDSSTLEDLRNKLNSSGLGEIVSYDKNTGAYSISSAVQASITVNRIGSSQQFDLNSLFQGSEGISYESGQDAKVNVLVNDEPKSIIRSNNTFELEGMNVTVKETFAENTGDVTFKSNANAEGILEGIRGFVSDYNELVKSIHEGFATRPAEKNSKTHATYEPLTEKDKEGMSDSAIEKYEEKAKQGILFGDTNLSQLYSRLTNMVSSGSNARELQNIGITTTYADGVTTLQIDEQKLTRALESDAGNVADIFNRTSSSNGSKAAGLMTTFKSVMDEYASTSSASPGVLVREAGTKRSSNSLLNNNVQNRITSLEEKISNWQTKMSAKIDYYSRQFTALEKLMSTMNNQSSMLAGLMGY